MIRIKWYLEQGQRIRGLEFRLVEVEKSCLEGLGFNLSVYLTLKIMRSYRIYIQVR